MALRRDCVRSKDAHKQLTALTISLPELILETCSVVLTFGSVDETKRCDHLNEAFLAVVLHGTTCFFNIL